MFARKQSLVVAVSVVAFLVLGVDASQALTLPSVPGLVLHLDADDPSSITYDGSNRVSQWNDLSSSTNHATAGGALRPLYVPGAWDGGVGLSRGVIRFAAATDEVLITQNNSPFSGNGFGITVFAVVKLNVSPGAFSSVVSQSPGTATNGMSFVIGSNQGGTAFTDHWQPRGRKATNPVPVGGNGQVITWLTSTWQDHATAAEIYYNGLAETMTTYGTAGVPSLTAKPFRIGNWDETRVADDMVFPGDLAEILVYSGALSVSDRQSIEAYLDQKWFQPIPVPEPSVLLLTGFGLAGLASARRRKR